MSKNSKRKFKRSHVRLENDVLSSKVCLRIVIIIMIMMMMGGDDDDDDDDNDNQPYLVSVTLNSKADKPVAPISGSNWNLV